MTNRKIGVITVHKNTNYGANLQAFASTKYINQLGYDCCLVDYYSEVQKQCTNALSWIKLSYKREQNKTFLRKIKLALALILSLPRKSRRIKGFAKFRKKYIKLSSPCESATDVSNLGLDTIVCGSDQVWNPAITGGINPLFFGDVYGVKTKISYAPSMGRSSFNKDDEEIVKDLVSKMDSVSVREKDSACYIQNLAEKEVSCVVDPVFLLDKSCYDEILGKRKISKPYVFLYSVISDPELSDLAVQYANKNGLQLIEVCDGKKKGYSHKQVVDASPIEFLNYIKYSDVVFTNSFHGTAFSIIFEKEFYSVDNKHAGSRIRNLLSISSLSDRLTTMDGYHALSKIDYTAVKESLSSIIETSKAFLEKALKSEKVSLAGDACFGCGACLGACRVDAIKLISDQKGFFKGYIDQAKCINCGACKIVCPAISGTEFNHENEGVFGYKASDEIRKNSASGGAFCGIATKFISDGGVVLGATTLNDFTIKHQTANSDDGLKKLQGTKYVQSDTSKVYSEIKNNLKDGKKVLFSGTPCQVAGVKNFVKLNKLNDENLYLIDIVCHGAPSPRYFKEFTKYLNQKLSSPVSEYRFRDKSVSWRGNSNVVLLKDGKALINDKLASSYMNVYYSGNVTNECCYSCPYAKKERVSDVTVSDYWGLENVAPSFEDKLGVSMVIANTKKGRAIFDDALGQKISTSLEGAKQPQLSAPAKRPKERDEFWNEYFNCGIEIGLKKYGGLKKPSLKQKLSSLKKKVLGK